MEPTIAKILRDLRLLTEIGSREERRLAQRIYSHVLSQKPKVILEILVEHFENADLQSAEGCFEEIPHLSEEAATVIAEQFMLFWINKVMPPQGIN